VYEAEEIMKISRYGAVKAVEAAGHAVQSIAKQVEEDRKRKHKEKLLDDVINFVQYDIIDDD
jgi:hypothetical protein